MFGLYGYLGAGVGAAILAAIAMHAIDADHYGVVIAQAHAKALADMKAVSDAAAEDAAANLKLQQEQMAQTQADADRAYKDFQNDQAARDHTVSDIDSGSIRLSVPVTCPAGSGSLPQAAAAAGVVHGAATVRADLDITTARRVVAITGAGDSAIAKLKACQQYVRDITGAK